MQVVLPDAASQERTEAVLRQVEQITKRGAGCRAVVSVAGFDLISGTAASNGALVIVKLKPWARAPDRRTSTRSAIVGKLYYAMQGIPEALVMPFNPPALPGMGSVSGFSFMLQARGEPVAGGTGAGCAGVHRRGAAAARDRPHLDDVQRQHAELPAAGRPREGEEARRADQRRAHDAADVPRRLPGQRLHSLRPQLQGDDAGRVGFPPGSQRHLAPVRAQPRRRHGAARHADVVAGRHGRALPAALQPVPHGRVQRLAGPGRELGRCAAGARRGGRRGLPEGYGFEWSGQSKQEIEAGNSSVIVLALSIVVVFLFLAALYESWAVPFAVLLATPFGFLGALLASSSAASTSTSTARSASSRWSACPPRTRS